MNRIQSITDLASIGLSFICLVHCLALPIVLVMTPSLSAFTIEEEVFHQWILIAVIPTSLVALASGCKHHKRYRFFLGGAAGLATLMFAALVAKSISHDLEIVMTVIGTIIIATVHFYNFKACKDNSCCERKAEVCPN